MKVGDKVIVDPRLHKNVWSIPVEDFKGKIMTIESINDFACYVKESELIFRSDMFIPVEGTLFLAIHERRQYETRRQSSS